MASDKDIFRGSLILLFSDMAEASLAAARRKLLHKSSCNNDHRAMQTFVYSHKFRPLERRELCIPITKCSKTGNSGEKDAKARCWKSKKKKNFSGNLTESSRLGEMLTRNYAVRVKLSHVEAGTCTISNHVL